MTTRPVGGARRPTERKHETVSPRGIRWPAPPDQLLGHGGNTDRKREIDSDARERQEKLDGWIVNNRPSAYKRKK